MENQKDMVNTGHQLRLKNKVASIVTLTMLVYSRLVFHQEQVPTVV